MIHSAGLLMLQKQFPDMDVDVLVAALKVVSFHGFFLFLTSSFRRLKTMPLLRVITLKRNGTLCKQRRW